MKRDGAGSGGIGFVVGPCRGFVVRGISRAGRWGDSSRSIGVLVRTLRILQVDRGCGVER
jgi:hypothetical protein